MSEMRATGVERRGDAELVELLERAKGQAPRRERELRIRRARGRRATAEPRLAFVYMGSPSRRCR